MPQWPGFIGGSNTAQSLIADAERTVNLYVEKSQSQGARAPQALYPTPGFQQFVTVADAVSRALREADGRLFAVIGPSFYEILSTGVAIKRGTVVQDTNPAQLVYNGKVGGQLGVASGGNVYSFTLATNVFAGPHFGGASITMLDFADGYGLGFDANTARVYLSALNDFTTWSLGTFFQRSKFPDPWRAMFVDANSLIWMLGSATFEVWQNTGTGTQPWAPLSGLYGRDGIAAPFAFGVSGAGNCWLSRSGPEGGLRMVLTKGGAPQPVSTYAVNTALAGYRRSDAISDAELLLYHDQGHTFANFAFPTAGATWAYDVEGPSWAERGQWDSATGAYKVWAPRVHADCFNKHFVGDRTSGTVWVMDTAYATDVDGTGIRRVRRSPALNTEHKRTPINQVELIMDTGVGLAAGQGSDPEAMLRLSIDGGRTFGNELRAGFGRIGKYGKRVFWNRLGAPADAVIEVSWSDPVPVRVIDALINNAEQAA